MSSKLIEVVILRFEIVLILFATLPGAVRYAEKRKLIYSTRHVEVALDPSLVSQPRDTLVLFRNTVEHLEL
jgi:hypothetical protein